MTVHELISVLESLPDNMKTIEVFTYSQNDSNLLQLVPLQVEDIECVTLNARTGCKNIFRLPINGLIL